MLRDMACEGVVLHRRTDAVRHEFSYPVWMLWIDVDGLNRIQSRLFSSRYPFAPLSLRCQDFPGGARPSSAGIREGINERLSREGYAPADRVFLLTQPRSWGWLFNPVSFYFCYRNDVLSSVVAEVTNTPWDEVYSYVLPADGHASRCAGKGCGHWEFVVPKRFHVSPFQPMDLDYRWRIKVHPESLEIAMHLSRAGGEVFFAGLYLQLRELTARALRRGALAYPLQNLRTLTRFYWQAFQLWRRGAPFHGHPGRSDEADST